MPNFDGRGPNGAGKLTGRGLGPCNSDSSEESVEGFVGKGFGRGLGRGFKRGSRHTGATRGIRRLNNRNL
jgi:hypothetical protein